MPGITADAADMMLPLRTTRLEMSSYCMSTGRAFATPQLADSISNESALFYLPFQHATPAQRAAGEAVFLSSTPLWKVFSFLGWLRPFM